MLKTGHVYNFRLETNVDRHDLGGRPAWLLRLYERSNCRRKMRSQSKVRLGARRLARTSLIYANLQNYPLRCGRMENSKQRNVFDEERSRMTLTAIEIARSTN